MKRIALALALLIVALALGVSTLAPPSQADRVHLRDGRVLEGRVIKEDDSHVQLEKEFGGVPQILTFERHEVVKIERVLTPRQEFEEAFKKCKTGDDFVKLAATAKEKGLDSEQKRCFEEAVKRDPKNKEAHLALGHVLHEGKWMTEREYKTALGWVEIDGEFVPPDQVEARREERRAAARKRAADSQERIRQELEGRPFADAEPITTSHYIVKCNAGKDDKLARAYADFLEKLWEKLNKLFRKYKRQHGDKSKVYIFANAREFYDTTNMEEGVGGYFFASGGEQFGSKEYDRLLAGFHGTFGATGNTYLVLAHEGTHQYQNSICEGTHEDWALRPTWWVEGLAVYFGDGFKFDKKKNIEIDVPRDRLAQLQQNLRGGQLTEFGGVKGMPALIRLPHRLYSGFYYAHGWGLCYYLMHRGQDKKGANKPVKLGDKEIDLAKVFEDFTDFVVKQPPADVKGRFLQGDWRSAAEHYAGKLESLLGIPGDRTWDVIESDYKDFILQMELKKLGKVKVNTYTSNETFFEVSKPGDSKWKFDEDSIQGDEAIRMVNDSTTGLIRVSVDGNMTNDEIEKVADDTERGLGFSIESAVFDKREPIDLPCGHPAWELVYSGKARQAANATKEVQVRTNEQRFRHVVVVTLKRIYHIICQADSDRFAENEEAFAEVLKKFKVLPEQ